MIYIHNNRYVAARLNPHKEWDAYQLTEHNKWKPLEEPSLTEKPSQREMELALKAWAAIVGAVPVGCGRCDHQATSGGQCGKYHVDLLPLGPWGLQLRLCIRCAECMEQNGKTAA
jgi:hypothetical protein